MASAGRPSKSELNEAAAQPVLSEVQLIDRRKRVRIPNAQLDSLRWFDREGGGEALAILEEPGRIRLVERSAHREAVDRRRQRLIARGTVDALEDLRDLDDTYRDLMIEADGRVTLTPVLFHLGEPEVSRVVVVRYLEPQSVEIWSIQFRNEERARRASKRAGLP